MNSLGDTSTLESSFSHRVENVGSSLQSSSLSRGDVKIYHLARKIFEGLALIMANIVTLGLINICSCIRKEYLPVFGFSPFKESVERSEEGIKNSIPHPTGDNVHVSGISDINCRDPVDNNIERRDSDNATNVDIEIARDGENSQNIEPHSYEETIPSVEIDKSAADRGKVVSLECAIEAIVEAKKAGKQIGLVIGRELREPLPEEEGWLWVSGNIEGETQIAENRVHLSMDFSDIGKLPKIKSLFKRVVVDFSTQKFLRVESSFLHSWRRLVPLLDSVEGAQLIIEDESTYTLSRSQNESVYRDFSKFLTIVPSSMHGDSEKIAEEMDKSREEFKEKFLKFFGAVEFKRGVQYPTREDESFTWGRTGAFIILTNPDKRLLDRRK